jgi:hypothetical protein
VSYNMTNTSSVEPIFYSLEPAIITILLVLLLRFVLNKILLSLAERGTLTIATKATIMRFIDITVFFVVVVVVLQVLVPPYQVLIAVSIIIVLGLFLFFYELREFMAYINLQLLRHLRGKTFEILLPHHTKPIYGRIISIDLLGSTIEDIYGRRIHVANTLLMNAILREHIPSIMLRISLNNPKGELVDMLSSLIDSLKNLDVRLFRIDERKISIEKMSNDVVVLRLIAYPSVTPVRIIDVINLVNRLNTMLRTYNPVIEILELT